MNVTELIRILKTHREEFFRKVRDLGFSLGERAIKVNDRVAKQIIETWQQSEKKEDRRFFKEKKEEETQIVGEKIVAIPSKITVKQFSEKLHKNVPELIAVLMQNGIMATINQSLDYETATIIAQDLGYQVKKEEEKNNEEEQTKKISEILKGETGLHDRPPVIVIMGHVDHGKTKLIEAIRKIELLSLEAGGITQHIGAYQVEHNGRRVTIIDTPGHEAFSAMRSRGANVADIAVLVVAADDGVQPQTVEAIEIMEKAELPFVVAINKIDRPEADQEKIKKQLSELNLIPEDWGGKTICVPISAKQGTGINELLDMILLLADLNKEKIQANADRLAVGTIIESKIDKNAGPLATVVVQTGTLRTGDFIVAGGIPGKVRALKTWKGGTLQEAGPSTPVQIFGLKGAPRAGDILQATKDAEILKKKIKEYRSFSYIKVKEEEGKNKKVLNVFVKADGLGSIEAILSSLEKIQHPEVKVRVIHKGLGNITESDINQADAAHALIVGFNVALPPTLTDYLLGKNTTVKTFTIIYELLDFVKEKLSELITPELSYKKIGQLKILAIFRQTERYQIAGGRILEGEIRDKHLIKIVRNGDPAGEGKIVELQSEKKNVSSLSGGKECGLKFEGTVRLEEGDVLEVYEEERTKVNL